MNTQEKAQEVNTYYENHDSETRLWMTDNGMWFICSTGSGLPRLRQDSLEY